MAAETFAALFLAHVLADYMLQTTWMVVNKRRPIALGLHIATVYVVMVVVTLSLSPWLLLLALAHLCIDIVKTFLLPNGLASYVVDQVLHLSSILAISLMAPGLWASTPLAGIEFLPMAYAVLGAVIFASRGGQFAIDILLAGRGASAGTGVMTGVIERSLLAAAIISGVIWLVLGVIALKLGVIASVWAGKEASSRERLAIGSVASLAWTLVAVVPLAVWLTPAL